MRFGLESTEPLIVAAASGAILRDSLVRLEPAGVQIAALKPSRDGKALILRLFNVTGTDARATLSWPKNAPKAISFSDLSERAGEAVNGPIPVAANDMVTVRAEMM